ncbi:MAG TPA: hypothetical protein VN673_14900 [Clostridia bacterium]|nr:hypothetical protein [Clostridia bacterium]
MNNRPVWLLSASLAVLMVANLAVRGRPQPQALVAESFNSLAKETGSGSEVHTPPVAQAPAEGSLPTESSAPKHPEYREKTFHWAVVETTDYKQYAVNLRSLGFPEELVQAIVIADINKQYEPYEAALRRKPVPFDAPVSQRQTKVTAEELLRMRGLRDVLIQKQAAIRDILGIYVPRETITTPTARNYIGYEYALSLLSPEKREAAQLALENEWFADDVNKHLDHASYVEVYRRTREERNAALNAVLTPEEFERFEMKSNPAGTELARRVIGMQPTEEEFLGMFRIARDHWVETGGVGGLWRAERVAPDQIAVADAKMEARMQEVLGPQRYLDYQMATSETGQQLRNLAARYDLPRDTLQHVFQLQLEAGQLLRATAQSRYVENMSDPSQLYSQLEKLQRQTEQILGPTVYRAWIDGRKRTVKLEP